MFSTVLVANRGEIAVRVTRTLRRLGVRSAVVYSDADARRPARPRGRRRGARRTRRGCPAAISSVDAVVAAAVSVGADAVHPGYGFLAENADFARACAVGRSGLRRSALRRRSRRWATRSARSRPSRPPASPSSPGSARPRPDRRRTSWQPPGASASRCCSSRPRAVGGKGMRRVDEPGRDAARPIASARREARTAFGDDTLLIERFVDRPRHIEVQVLADTLRQLSSTWASASAACSAGTRRSSRRRRRPCSRTRLRASIGASAVRTAQACGYVGAGTVEFIVAGDAPDDLLLHGDEHPAPGRAPGHRAGHRHRPGRAAAAGGLRRAPCDGVRTTCT